MDRMKIESFILATILAFCCALNQDTINPDLVISKVERKVDLTTHLPRYSDSITIENTGKSTVKSFLVAVDPEAVNSIAYVGALVKGSEEDEKLEVSASKVVGNQNSFYRISLPSALEAGKEKTVTVEQIFTHSLSPYPSQISQAEKQFVQFHGNAYVFSPYKITSQTTIFTCASSNIESYSKNVKPVHSSDSSVTYGTYENKEPFSQAAITVHFENNAPFLTVTKLTRVIEVSHWGNIAVEETLDLYHSGAKLKGPFSRYDYQRQQDGAASIKSFKTMLPSAARDVYYRDEIGNISTSHMREQDDAVELELRPRFPLFGGWKTHYYIGYNVPSYQYLYNEGDRYALKMRFLDHIFDDQVVDHITVKIILPEGSKNMKLDVPYPVTREADEVIKTYLDTTGRPIIIAHKSNLVDNHVQDFTLSYDFQKIMLLQEPFLVVGAFYLLFLIVIIYVRLDFSITKDEASESRMRVASLLEQVQGLQDRRSACYQSYDDAVNKYKANKDSGSFNTNRKKVDADYKQLTTQIAGVLSKLKSEGSESAEKVQELQKLDSLVRDQVNLAIQYAEKLIAGKLSKQQYVDYESTVKSKRDDFYGKIDAVLNTL